MSGSIEYRRKINNVPNQVRENVIKKLGPGRHKIRQLIEEEYLDSMTPYSTGSISRNMIGYIVTTDEEVEAVNQHGNPQVLPCRVDTIFIDEGPVFFERRTPIKKIFIAAFPITDSTAITGCLEHPDFGKNYFASTPNSIWAARSFAFEHLDRFHKKPT